MIINIILIILMFALPSEIGCLALPILIFRGINWLFGPCQDMMDDYYYTRYKNAQTRYERRRNK